MSKNPEDVCLFDMDGTLCDYEKGLIESLTKLRSPMEPLVIKVPLDNAPAYLRARSDLIRKSTSWWAELPQFKLGFDVWKLALQLEFRRMILTQGPKRNSRAWAGKKMWIDSNLGMEVDITITRDKGLVYGRILVDDWPLYVERWLEWRPRGLVIMPASRTNIDFKHSQVIRYDGSNLDVVRERMAAMKR